MALILVVFLIAAPAYGSIPRAVRAEHFESGASTPAATTESHFDLNGRVVGRTDPKGYTTAYDYDVLNRRTAVRYADGSAEQVLTYDAMRRPLTVRQQDGTVVTNVYDEAGRVVSRTTTAPSGVLAVSESFAYDGLGRMTLQQTAGGADTLATSTAWAYNDTVNPPTVTKTITVGTVTSDPITTTYNHAGEVEFKTLPGGRTLGYSHNAAGQLSGVTSNGAPVASIQHVGGRRASLALGGSAVTATTSYNTSQDGTRPTGTEHVHPGTTETTLDARSNTWDDNYNRTGRSVTAGPAALQTSHSYTYDGLDRMEASDDGGGAFTYTLDAAGNRTATSDGAYGFNGTGMLLHQYATGPGSAAYGYDAAGRLASLSASGGRSYVYDALGRLKEVRLVAGASLSAMNELPAGAEPESGTWALTDDGTGNKFLEDTGATPGRILWPPPAGMQVFSFTYWTGHDPSDPDGDSDTSEDDPDHFDPKYYAQVMLRATQYEAPDPKEGEWRFLALVIQPDGLYLREFDGDHVEELGKAEVDIPNGQWHTVTIELGGEDGNHVVVKQLLNGAEKAERIEAETSIPGGGKVGFGVGSDANFRFDNVGTRQDVTLTAAAALRYHYDANGRVVGRTLNPGEVDEESQFFIYDGDRIIQELNGEGDLVAAWDYGVYIDEILAMHRDTNNDGTLDTYYYLQDDLYNVVGLADASGTVVERYAYNDYGAPTIYTGDGTTTRTESAYFNPFLFQGHRWDEFLKLYDYRTRYYDPKLGRFLRIDAIGLWGDANNLGNPYAFVGNNPWSRLDPYGEGVGELVLFGQWNPSDEELAEGYNGFTEGATGGATIVADTFTFNQIDALNAQANSYQGSAYTASRFLAVGSREVLITAGTLGIGNAALNGGRVAQTAHKGILIYEAGSGGYQVGTGINKIVEGDTLGGTLDIVGGGLRVGGSVLSAREFNKAIALKPQVVSTEVLHAEARAQQIHQAVPAGTQSRTTIAVTETEEGVRVVSSSERRLRPAQRRLLQSGEIEGVGIGHAEVTGTNAAREAGLSPTGTAASRPICPTCGEFLRDADVSPLSPLK